jgi:hypothetical protein
MLEVFCVTSLYRAHTVTLEYYAMWTIDVDTGVVTVPATGKRYEAEHAEISGRAGTYSPFVDYVMLC